MKRATLLLIAVAAGAILASCSPKAGDQRTTAAEQAPAPAAAPASPDMSGMATSGAKMARGQGTVTAIDAKAGAVTLDHGPIAEANWPAMTMAFKASPAIVGRLKVGDRVDFDLKLENGAGEITAVRKPQG